MIYSKVALNLKLSTSFLSDIRTYHDWRAFEKADYLNVGICPMQYLYKLSHSIVQSTHLSQFLLQDIPDVLNTYLLQVRNPLTCPMNPTAV